jgi:hypothetical protein
MPLAALAFLASGCRPEAAATPPTPAALQSFPGAKTSEGLEVSAALDDSSAPPRVGFPVRFRVRLRNVSDKSVSFGHEAGEAPVRSKLRYSEPFGDKRGPDDRAWGGGRWGSSCKSVVRLAPGQTWELSTAVVPKLPGAATFCLNISNDSDRYWDYIKGQPLPDGAVPVSYGMVPMENPWKGRANFHFPLEIGACSYFPVTPSREDRRRTLAKEDATPTEKIRALEFSGDERTGAAVAFLLEQVKALPAGSPLRPFAVRQLADMASAGYGFEAIDLLFEVAGNAAEPANVRALTAELVSLLRGQRSVRFVVDSNEGEYLVSEPLRQRAQAIWAAGQKP